MLLLVLLRNSFSHRDACLPPAKCPRRQGRWMGDTLHSERISDAGYKQEITDQSTFRPWLWHKPLKCKTPPGCDKTFLTRCHWMQSVVIQCSLYLLYASCEIKLKKKQKTRYLQFLSSLCMWNLLLINVCVSSNEICLKIQIIRHLFEALNSSKSKQLLPAKLLMVVDNSF